MKNPKNSQKSDKCMTDKSILLKISFVKWHCLFVKLFAIENAHKVACVLINSNTFAR